jgi:plastocyanin
MLSHALSRGRMTTFAIAGGVLALVAALPVAPVPAQPATATIQIKDHAFVPATLTVAPGTKVTWANADDDTHDIVEANKLFRSPALDTDDRFSYTFTTPGEFDYFCALHTYMVGKVIVKAANG